jgi:hypothetical protein
MTGKERIARTMWHLAPYHYWLSPKIRKGQGLPGASTDLPERARDILTCWGAWIANYAVRDYYEFLQAYYRPRVQAYVQALRQRLRLNQRQFFPSDQLDKQNAAIEEKGVKDGFPLLEKNPEPERVIATVEDILAHVTPSGVDSPSAG